MMDLVTVIDRYNNIKIELVISYEIFIINCSKVYLFLSKFSLVLIWNTEVV